MSDYTPSAEELVLAAVNIPEAEARRGIAKVKADALREAANALPRPVGLSCNPECHNVDWASLRIRADLIEGQ